MGGIVKTTYPMPQMSISAPYCLAPKSNSGGRYHLVTTQFVYLRLWEPVSVATDGSNVRARPKSAIFKEPSLEMSKLAAFMSRCKIWFLDDMSTRETTIARMPYPVHIFGAFHELAHVKFYVTWGQFDALVFEKAG